VTHGMLLTDVMCSDFTYQSIIVDLVLDCYEGILMMVCEDGDARSKGFVFMSLVLSFVARSAAA